MRVGICMPMNAAWNKAVDGLEASAPAGTEIVRGMDACLASFASLDAVVANPIDASYYGSTDRLKAVFVPFVGVNHLPADMLMRKGIAVYNCHGNAESVAERALALALAGFGRIVEYHNDLKRGHWHGFWVGKGQEDYWHSIFHKRCAILGVGAIGETLARLLKAFDCTVVGYRRRLGAPKPAHFDEVSGDLASVVSGADIVFIALPLTDGTRGLVGAEALAAMKGPDGRGAFLVNVGRGDIVDEEALYGALKDGPLAGAGLDVWYQYPKGGSTEGFPSRFPIHELPNVVLSPHVAGSTHEAVVMNIDETVANLGLWLRSGDAAHRVDLAASY